MERHLLLGCHDILVARTENLVDLGHRFRAVGHGTDGLHATGLEYLAHAGYSGSHEYGWVHLAFAVGWCAEHYLATPGNLGWRGEHENGGEERGGATGYVESHFLDGHAFLPTHDTRGGLYFVAFEMLCLVELLYVVVGEYECLFQVIADQLLCLLNFFGLHGELMQMRMIELLFVFAYGLVAAVLHVFEN